MIPKAKAKELIHRYDLMQTYVEGFSYYNAKECALIAVDEILKSPTPKQEKYWQEVKNEINKL